MQKLDFFLTQELEMRKTEGKGKQRNRWKHKLGIKSTSFPKFLYCTAIALFQHLPIGSQATGLTIVT